MLANPFPNGIDVAAGAAAGLNTFLGRGISFFCGKPLNPYNQRWSFSVQRELPGRILADVSYVGNRGTHIGVTRELNAVSEQYSSTSPAAPSDTRRWRWTASPARLVKCGYGRSSCDRAIRRSSDYRSLQAQA